MVPLYCRGSILRSQDCIYCFLSVMGELVFQMKVFQHSSNQLAVHFVVIHNENDTSSIGSGGCAKLVFSTIESLFQSLVEANVNQATARSTARIEKQLSTKNAH